MASLLQTLQQEIADRLSGDPFFADITVIWELKNDVLNEVEKVVSQLGCGVMVVTPTATVNSPNLPGPWYDDIGIVVQCYYDPVLKPEGPRAMEIAEKVAALLHHWTPASLSSPLVGDKPTIVPSPTETPGLDGRDVHLTGAGGAGIEVPQVETPMITNDGGELSLSCGTPGAALFYTTNGRRPSPRVGTLYLAPFSPDPGSRVRVLAWLAGYLTSEEASLIA